MASAIFNYPPYHSIGANFMIMTKSKAQTIKQAIKAWQNEGLLYLFLALWVMFIFGNDSRFWSSKPLYELFVWVPLFAAVAVWAIWLGMKKDSGVLRGYGLVFLLINIYTRFFEHFWDELHMALFFGILSLSLWLLGSKAEKIWQVLAPKHFDPE